MPPIYFDDFGLSYSTLTGQITVADFAIYGCPAAEINNGVVTVPPGQGLFRGPNGAVRPGLRPIGPIRTPPTPTFPHGGFTMSDVSISHAMDFERVEPLVVQE